MRDDLLGSEIEPFEVTIEGPLNQYFLGATEEDQPFYLEGKAAPPTSLFGPARPGYPDPLEFMGTSFDKAVMGSAAYEIARPPLVGETLVCRGRVADVKRKETPKGTMTFATLEATFTDSSGAVVVTERLTFIERP
ncbi:MAG TPA: MaoC family dehydratase N-terminal domain-containing protein [Acidimicrobiia bacterium]|nr:MaoC family dehydratase N-terminal domain-containing protein [Acidimicrobiia bacterium]